MTENCRSDDRAITSPVSFTLTVAMAMLLVTGLIYAGSAQVENQRSATARAQMDVVGQQVAANLEAADRMVRASEGDPSTLTIERRLPTEIVGTSYSVTVETDAVVVSSPVLDENVRVPVEARTDVAASDGGDSDATINGGQIAITYDSGDDELEVDDA